MWGNGTRLTGLVGVCVGRE
ncbi:hypothetical protein E2C01_065877 [Portunus trituberculatus]|uniref:Uncharacterized protein n=1 Tax=Portunus trituberculatus TaxID=210409 RepID=A0A5B7HPL0_PORTR|nr:hypothetical protein [Portunus trituberculatus]